MRNWSIFFLPPTRPGFRGHHYNVLRRRGSAFSVRFVKYWNKLPPLIFQEKVGSSADRGLSPSSRIKQLLIEYYLYERPTPFLHLHATHLQPPFLYFAQFPVLFIRFLQACCGLLFHIISYNHKVVNGNFHT